MYTGKRGYLKNINLLWHLNYWDGMISGVGEIDGYKVYFDQISNKQPLSHYEKDNNSLGEGFFTYYEPRLDTPEFNEYDEKPFYGLDLDIVRYYYVYDFSKESMDKLVESNKIFNELVGNHTNYEKNMRVDLEKRIYNYTDANWELLKEKTKNLKVDYEKEIIFKNRIGWFDNYSLKRG